MILVVGGTGELGLAIVRALRARREDVRVLAREGSDVAAVVAAGASIFRGDLRDPDSLTGVCDGVEVVVSTANSIVPRRGERVREGELDDGHLAVATAARAAGVRRLVVVGVPPQFLERGAIAFDERARLEPRLRATGVPLSVVRASLFMQSWLPAVGSRLAVRGAEHATIDRGFWLTRMVGATTQRSIDRWGVAVVPGDGSARHSFIDVADLAEAIAAATRVEDLPDEVLLGGPEALSWDEVVDAHAQVLGRRLRRIHQPAAPFAVAARVARRRSPAAAHLLAVQALVSTVDSVCPPQNLERLLGRPATSVADFLSSRPSAPA